jgi:hypothetical protein
MKFLHLSSSILVPVLNQYSLIIDTKKKKNKIPVLSHSSKYIQYVNKYSNLGSTFI